MRKFRSLYACLTILLCSLSGIAEQPKHLFFRVTIGPQFTMPVSGRLLIFLTPGSGAKDVDENPFAPAAVYVAAKEIADLPAGASVDVDTDDLVFRSLSRHSNRASTRRRQCSM
jgi:hypothetical protein